jgi:type IV pilus assembly protein PilQ
MMHVWTLAAAVSAAAITGRAPAAAHTVTAGPPATATSSATPTDASAPVTTSVTQVSVVRETGRAVVVIAVDSSAQVQDFVLESTPYRVVLDVTGAKLGVAPQFYDKVARGGIANIRYAQYKAGVVRVVIELNGPRDYTMSRGPRDVRLVFDGEAPAFTAWNTSVSAAPVEVALAPAVPQRTVVPPPGSEVTRSEAAVPVVATSAGAVTATPKLRNDHPTFIRQGNQSSQPRIGMTYQDADIRDVLAAFAAFSGRTIVVGKDVQGTVTAEIRDQPWDVALQSILSSQQLAATEDQYGIITVDSYKNIQAKQASEPLVTQLVSINYASAGGMVPVVRSLLSKDCAGATGGLGGTITTNQCQPRGNVIADTATNTLLITEAQSHLQDVVNYVRDLDVRTPQVSIRAKIIFINRTLTNTFGIAYDFGDNGTFFNSLVQRIDPSTGQPYLPTQTVINVGGNALAAVSNAARPYANGSALSLLYTVALGRFSLTSFLDASISLQLSDVQAEPSVVTLNNREAQIQVGEETPIRVIDASSAAQGGAARATVQFKETGIILNVTPHITNNGQILMQLHAEQSQLQDVGGDLGYNFFKRAADTKLLVNDGETAVIAGLTETTITKSRNAIPLLGELPVLGNLFAQTQSLQQKQDLLILISPHVMPEDDGPPRRQGGQ